MLRAYRWAIDPSWSEKHNLIALAQASGVLLRLSEKKAVQVQAALNELARRWSVSHRYAPSDSLEAYLKEILNRNDQRILRDNSTEMITLAQTILVECDKRCP